LSSRPSFLSSRAIARDLLMGCLTTFGMTYPMSPRGLCPRGLLMRRRPERNDRQEACHRMFILVSWTLKPSYSMKDMERERRKDSINTLSLVLRDRSGCFGLSFPFLNLNQNIRLKSLHHNTMIGYRRLSLMSSSQILLRRENQ